MRSNCRRWLARFVAAVAELFEASVRDEENRMRHANTKVGL